MQEKSEFIDVLNTVFPEDGIENVTRLFEYDFENSHKIELDMDGRLCGWVFYETKHQDKNDAAYATNDYMKNIVLDTIEAKKAMGENDIYVSLIVVNPFLQKRGFGKALISLLADQNKDKEYLYLWADNTCNNRFYEQLKFENVGEFDTPYGYHTIIYRKKINELNRCASEFTRGEVHRFLTMRQFQKSGKGIKKSRLKSEPERFRWLPCRSPHSDYRIIFHNESFSPLFFQILLKLPPMTAS